MKKYPPMPRLGLGIGDRVMVDEAKLHPADRGFLKGVGIIEDFTDSPNACNNGAAVVKIENKYGDTIRPCLNTDVLIKQEPDVNFLVNGKYVLAASKLWRSAYNIVGGKQDSVTKALRVMVLDDKIMEYLAYNDPQALKQAQNALFGKSWEDYHY